jgi:hypothetical protein
MKKSTIKRRKRVVPAYADASGVLQQTASISPEPMSPDVEGQQQESTDHSPAPKRRRLPPTVDYTGYVPQDTTEDTARPAQRPTDEYTLQAQLAAVAAAEGMRLDPALINAGRQPRPVEQAVDDAGQATSQETEYLREERRAQLMREAEVMRAALRAKEREIDELG